MSIQRRKCCCGGGEPTVYPCKCPRSCCLSPPNSYGIDCPTAATQELRLEGGVQIAMYIRAIEQDGGGFDQHYSITFTINQDKTTWIWSPDCSAPEPFNSCLGIDTDSVTDISGSPTLSVIGDPFDQNGCSENWTGDATGGGTISNVQLTPISSSDVPVGASVFQISNLAFIDSVQIISVARTAFQIEFSNNGAGILDQFCNTIQFVGPCYPIGVSGDWRFSYRAVICGRGFADNDAPFQRVWDSGNRLLNIVGGFFGNEVGGTDPTNPSCAGTEPTDLCVASQYLFDANYTVPAIYGPTCQFNTMNFNQPSCSDTILNTDQADLEARAQIVWNFA